MNRLLIAVLLAAGCRHAVAGPTCVPQADYSQAKDTVAPPAWDGVTVPPMPNAHAGFVAILNGGDWDVFLADPDNALVPWSATLKNGDLQAFISLTNGLAGTVDVVRKPPPPPPLQNLGRMALTLQYYNALGSAQAGF